MEWKYLLSEPFQVRHVLAAHFVRDCDHIVEVGGYKLPITWFLTAGQHKSITVIDPLVTPLVSDRHNGYVCTVRHVATEVQLMPIPESKFGLVALGLNVRGDPRHFYEMVACAEIVVLEFPPDFDPSVELFENTLAYSRKQITLKFDLDLSGNDFGDMTDSYPPRPKRRMVVLK